ncbi:hypothetical protein HMPREF1872_00363 [Amygdalobacter nucleatus]|uniref:Uncharacterized protein n=1 Tax=Amygdalobacter nucleatus TaxID=3029274 RepID=A0A133YG77_9FIRM|nr:hypothetical protein HMPREF1872_00363 [Amygdalobacter nucleatus]
MQPCFSPHSRYAILQAEMPNRLRYVKKAACKQSPIYAHA